MWRRVKDLERDLQEDPHAGQGLAESGYSEQEVFEAVSIQAGAGKLQYATQNRDSEPRLTDEMVRAAESAAGQQQQQGDLGCDAVAAASGDGLTDYKRQANAMAMLRSQAARKTLGGGASRMSDSAGDRLAAVKVLADGLTRSVDQRVSTLRSEMGGELASLEAKLEQAAEQEAQLMEMLEKMT